MYICMVAYMSAVWMILPERVVSAFSAYLVNCVYRDRICIYAWLPIWALWGYCLRGWYLHVALISLTVCAWLPICSCLELYLSIFIVTVANITVDCTLVFMKFFLLGYMIHF
jgi:hypothetical protein